MKILIVRHAKALDRMKAVIKKVPDSDRPLTEKGIKKFKAHVAKNKKSFLKTDLYVTSSFLRAQQTLDVIIASIENKKKLPNRMVLEGITPDDNPKNFIKWLQQNKKDGKYKKITVASHEPFMTLFLNQFLNFEWPAQKIKKGSLILLDFSGDKPVFKKIIHPKL